MGIDWTIMVIVVIAIGAAAGVTAELIKARAKAGEEAARAVLSDQFQTLAVSYDTLAKETRDSQISTQAALVDLGKKMETIEKILKSVG
jgi:predicted NBD/HSP70 family sugar kinase